MSLSSSAVSATGLGSCWTTTTSGRVRLLSSSQLRTCGYRAGVDTSKTSWAGSSIPGLGISHLEYPTARFPFRAPAVRAPAVSPRVTPGSGCLARWILADWTDLLMLKVEKSGDPGVGAGDTVRADRDAGPTLLTLLRNFSKEGDGSVTWTEEAMVGDGLLLVDCFEGERIFGLRRAIFKSG